MAMLACELLIAMVGETIWYGMDNVNRLHLLSADGGLFKVYGSAGF